MHTLNTITYIVSFLSIVIGSITTIIGGIIHHGTRQMRREREARQRKVVKVDYEWTDEEGRPW